MCHHANISCASLITLDDFPDYSRTLENLRFILVDHNKLQGELGKRYASSVYGVIDHHDEEDAILRDIAPEPRIIEKCGSCTSLVVCYCMPSWDSISSSSLASGAAHGQGEAAVDDASVTQGWDAQIAKMALASILIDTANLTAPGKVESVDKEAAEYLETKIQLSPKYWRTWNRDAYYDEIDRAKRDIDALNLSEILQKDYKQSTENDLNLGISSVVKPLDYLVGKGNGNTTDDDLMQFMDGQELSLFAIMTTSNSSKGEFRRELLVQAKVNAFSALDEFMKRAVSTLRLEPLHVENISMQESMGPNPVKRMVWLQKEVSQSRKQVAPLLRNCMKAIKTP